VGVAAAILNAVVSPPGGACARLPIAAELGGGPGRCRRVSATVAEQAALGLVGLPLVAVAFWWEDWPGSRLRLGVVGTHRPRPIGIRWPVSPP
jgi:hypothetical protein